MKFKNLFLVTLLLISCTNYSFAQTDPINTSQASCGTAIPDEKWENQLSALVKQTKANINANKQQAVPYTIPVIIHVIHGGQAVGTYPNLASGQLISQIQTLNNDYGGIGYNTSIYPINAFLSYANSPTISPNSLDALNRIKIANCGVFIV